MRSYIGFLTIIHLALWQETSAHTLLADLLDEYPNKNNCDLHYVTDGNTALDRSTLRNRAITLWKLSAAKEIPVSSMPTNFQCVLVFVNATIALARDFIQAAHLQGAVVRNQFYAVHVNGYQHLELMNFTEIFDFPNIILLVNKEVMILNLYMSQAFLKYI